MSEQKKQQNIQQLDRKQMKTLFQGLNFQDDITAGQKSVLPYDATDRLDQRQRAFVQHWSAVIERSDKGLTKLFLQHAPEALGQMGFEGTEAWLLHALEQFDQRGIGWAQQILRSVDRVATVWNSRRVTLSLNEILPLLRHLILGLGGRELRLVAGGQCYTDTETLYLPAELSLSDNQAENFRLYKATTVHHWAQTWYGTWRADILEQLLRLLQNHSIDEARRRLDGFCAFERLRLDACIARDLPGIWRDMLALRNRFGATVADKAEIWITASHQLAGPQASASDSLNWLLQLTDDVMVPPPDCYHGFFRPEQVHEILSKRLIRERERLQIMVGKLRDDLAVEETQPAAADNQPMRTRKPTEGFSFSQQPPRQGSNLNVRLYLDKQPVPIPDDMEQLLGSVLQDLGAIPEEYFRPGGQKPYDADHTGSTAGGDRAPEEYLTDNVLRYPEWDYMRQRFRPDYCMLREHDVTSGDGEFITATRAKYHGLLKSVRRSFEAIISESRLQRRQNSGDDIDLDALVAAQADVRHGEELHDNLYIRLRNDQRSIAVMFMVDMSGSTKGWVNQAEREALVLLCEALETIGDRYAIYGFSGRTHRRVDIYRVKRFEEPYNHQVKSRISGIEPRAYTRMGAPIRHLGAMLRQMPARTKLLITLSDGKPEDYGSYYGKYGIEDTRHALLELRRDGIHPFCITIDKEGSDYLPYMYGAANFACIDDVAKLPLKVADIYRRLTT